jgi:hypothetical protein
MVYGYKVDTVDHIQILYKISIVFLLDNYGARHERIATKAMTEPIPHTLTAGQEATWTMPFTVNRISTKGLKTDLWLRIMLVKQAYLY